MEKLYSRAYLEDALKYPSNRRQIFIEAFGEIRKNRGLPFENKELALSIIELLHSAATIIDDMQDNEVYRKDIRCYYVRNNPGVAAFASIRLWHEALCRIHGNFDLAEFLPHYENLLTSQEADTGLLLRSIEMQPIDWYFEIVSKKISEELLILFKLCNPASSKFDDFDDLMVIIGVIGQLIQFIDDRKDIIVENFLLGQNEGVVFTYSLPFAILLGFEPQYEEYIGKKIDTNLASELYGKLTADRIHKQVIEYIEEKKKEINGLISKQEKYAQNELGNLVAALESEYWELNRMKYAAIV